MKPLTTKCFYCNQDDTFPKGPCQCKGAIARRDHLVGMKTIAERRRMAADDAERHFKETLDRVQNLRVEDLSPADVVLLVGELWEVLEARRSLM